MLWLPFLADARAQTEACAGPLPLAEWDEALDQVDAALVALDGARSDGLLDDLVHELRCLDVPAPPDRLGRMARQVALVAFFAQDPDELGYWGLLARSTLGDAPWPPDVPVPPRFRELLAELPDPEVRRLEGQGLAVPKGGGALLDGRILLAPEAAVDAQHLFQVADKKGVVTFTGWQTGPAFPEDFLGEPADLDVPRWYEDPALTPTPAPTPAPAPVEDAAPIEAPTLSFDGDGASAECPWQGIPDDVVPAGKTVTIAGVAYPVKTDEEQLAFKKLLRACGEFRASRRFAKWRAMRGNPFAASRAWRDAMVEALRTPEPKRKKKPAPPRDESGR